MIVLFIGGPSSAQVLQRSWSDGDPVFLKTIKGPNVSLKEVATLQPLYEVAGMDRTLGYQLSGLDWMWPGNIPLISAEDIDSREVSDQTLYLVTDALGRRVFEINAKTRNETWAFPPSQNANDPTDPKYLNKPVDAAIFRDEATGYFKVVITDQDRNRVITIDKESSKIDWWYGDPLGREGIAFNQLRTPEDAEKIPNANEYIIADKGNNRVIIVEPVNNTILWELGAPVLNSPVDIQYLQPENRILITDQGNHRVIIVDRETKAVVWQFGVTGVADSGAVGLRLPTDADYLPASQSVLIADAGNNRLIEVDLNGKIVWQFHKRLKNLRDADRLPDQRTLAVYDNYPARLGYSDSLLASPVYDLGENKESIFDSLSWSANVLDATTWINLQLRSANSLSDLEGASWYGPAGTSDFYSTSDAAVNPVHSGHRFYQFRAYLHTNNPLMTPTLNQVLLKHHYYKLDALENAYLFTPDIKDNDGYVVVGWKRLEFKTILPADVNKHDKINLEIVIYDGTTRQPLERLAASKINENNAINLETFSSLNGVQRIYLVAYLSTVNSSVSPVLDNWKVSWEAMSAANSEVYFADRNGYPKAYYRATQVLPANEKLVDSLFIKLKDPDLEPFQSTYPVKVKSLKSLDSLMVDLNLLPAGGFFSTRGIPILISQSSDPYNQIVEAQDRDILTVSYRDAYNSLDVSSDSILVVKNTSGTMTMENGRAQQVTKAWFGDTLYIRIKGENDHNLSATRRDSIQVQVYDRLTMDEENLLLYELPSGAGRWDTGEFLSDGLVIARDNNGRKNNGEIEAMPGHNITAEYIDNVSLAQTVFVPDKDDTTNGGGNVIIYFGRDPFVVEVAPNPYYQGGGRNLSLRVASSTGALRVLRIEVFTLAGERVRLIDGDQLIFKDFGAGFSVPKDKYGYVENWWDLRNASGQYISSGTYWVKVHAELTNDETGRVEQVAFHKKFVIIR